MNAKERIDKAAINYVVQETGYQVLPEHDHWKKAYISGATAEHEKNAELLKEATLLIKEIQDKWISADHYWGSDTNDKVEKFLANHHREDHRC